MRNPLNKAANNRTAGTAPGKDNTMNDVFKKVAAAAATIGSSTPQLREEYVKGIEAAIDDQAKAREAKEEALTGVDFDNACDRERHAHEKETFFRRKLEDLDFTPRMDEKEYEAYVKSVQVVMNQAADEYREKATRLMKELAALHRSYVNAMDDADQVLSDLDRAANVLQSKYRYRECVFQDTPSQYVEDSYEWMKHAVRYGAGRGQKMVLPGGDNYDIYVGLAWAAGDRFVAEEDRLAKR